MLNTYTTRNKNTRKRNTRKPNTRKPNTRKPNKYVHNTTYNPTRPSAIGCLAVTVWVGIYVVGLWLFG